MPFLRTHLGGFTKAFAAKFGARCAINHLRSLDDDRLRDLGLEREDIERFVRFGRDGAKLAFAERYEAGWNSTAPMSQPLGSPPMPPISTNAMPR